MLGKGILSTKKMLCQVLRGSQPIRILPFIALIILLRLTNSEYQLWYMRNALFTGFHSKRFLFPADMVMQSG